ADRRFTPGDDLSGSGLRAWRVVELRKLPRQARRTGQRLRPSLHLAGDLGAPTATVGGDLATDPGPLDPAALPAFGHGPSELRRKSADLAAENPGQHLCLTRVGAIVDKDAGGALDPSRPEVALPPADPDEAQARKIDVAVVAVADVPEQYRLAEPVIRCL